MPVSSVLYVEDDKMWRDTLQRNFRRDLCPDVDVADGYASALDAVERRAYDLIISDGLEGGCFTLYEAVRGKHKGGFVVFSGDDRNKKQADESGIPFFAKPGDLKRLVEAYK